MPICRKVFQRILFLYPKAFRDEFGREMLETFEECEHSQSSWSLLTDTLLSALRQQVQYRSVPVPESAPPYPEIGVSPRLPRMMAGVALGAVLVAALLAPAERIPAQHPVLRSTGISRYEGVSPRAQSSAESVSILESYWLYSSMVEARYAQ